MTESQLHQAICQYLKYQYPNIIFHSDFGSGLKLTFGQAKKQRKLQSSRGYPDLFIAEPNITYHGLFIELKRERSKLKKKNGEYINIHIEEQANMLERLRKKGYKAEFGIGFEQTIEIINFYLTGNKEGNS